MRTITRVFVIDGEDGPDRGLDLAADGRSLSVEHLVGGPREQPPAARLRRRRGRARWACSELRWPGLRGGRRRVRNGPLQRAGDYLDDLGVPLWRDGTASLPQTLYFRGTWAAVALLIGFGSISVAVFIGADVTLAHIVVPALLCAAGVGLRDVADRPDDRRGAARRRALGVRRDIGAAAAAIIAVGALLLDRAVPALMEMWTIYTGDAALNQLAVRVSPDGGTLYVEGSYGLGGEETVRQALDQNPGIRTVVLAGPGGRISVGFELYEMFRERKLATRVDDECASACTFAFLGGVERSISPGGRLGFHRGSFPGLSDNDMYESQPRPAALPALQRQLTPQFADRVFATPPDEIWVPTPQELLAGRVINRVNR